nr:protein-L-isoaspartate O-methyltransferase [uncultured Kingella sp.]
MNFEQARFNMVEQQIRPWDVLDFDVLDALQEIPREIFVQPDQQGYAYADLALPLPNGSKMLEPKIVGRMVQGLALKKHERVLEVGTGSGYATAILAKLAYDVTTCDLDEQQLGAAQAILKGLQLDNIQYKAIDGLNALPSDARFDAIYIGGSLKTIPEQLLAHLNEGGRMVVVVGSEPVQRCLQITRHGSEFSEKTLFDTLITPLQDGNDTSWYKATGKFRF